MLCIWQSIIKYNNDLFTEQYSQASAKYPWNIYWHIFADATIFVHWRKCECLYVQNWDVECVFYHVAVRCVSKSSLSKNNRSGMFEFRVRLEVDYLYGSQAPKVIAQQELTRNYTPVQCLWQVCALFESRLNTKACLCFLNACMSVSRLNNEVPSGACLRDEMIWLQQNLSKLGSPVVLCHNDLLCKNIIYKQQEGESNKPHQLPSATAYVSPTPPA